MTKPIPTAGADAPRAYRAIFFDLDGTLLPMELEEFLSTYFKSIASFVAAHEVDPQAFSAGLKAGIGAMAAHDDGRTNHEAYWEAFFQKVDRTAADWDALLGEFYDVDFGKIGEGVQPNPATARAVEWRLTWAGVDPRLFARITTYENSTSVKPKPAYCAENLAACGLAGADVLMVGNNTVEDQAFVGLGTDMYLVTDHLLDPAGTGVEGVRHGTMEDFAAWTEALPACANPAVGIDPGVVSPAAREAALAANSRVADHEVARAVEVSGAFNAGAAASAHGALAKEA